MSGQGYMPPSATIRLGEWCSVSEAADRLDCSVTHVYRLLSETRLRAVDTPVGRLVEIRSVDQYDRERRGRGE